MCGRFVGYRNIEQLKRFFPIDESACEASANYNVAPTQNILALTRPDGKNVLSLFHWGLVPFWAKDTKIGYKMINARAETVATKPSFREAFKKRRCLILADGFYEWKGEKGEKQPMFITLPDQAPFAFAGLWETWQSKESPEEPYRSCTIITREAAGVMTELHHRMPIIFSPDAYAAWLDAGNTAPETLTEILQHKALIDLAYYPVTKQVNSVRHNEPANIQRV